KVETTATPGQRRQSQKGQKLRDSEGQAKVETTATPGQRRQSPKKARSYKIVRDRIDTETGCPSVAKVETVATPGQRRQSSKVAKNCEK
ncbi:hypothetical protein BaRGS_00000693, partial [Batillaria attramentaria]